MTQPNDLKGRIHLAGGSSDETGIRLDGHRLQEPFHMLGVLGAFNVTSLERADVLVHYIPARFGGRPQGGDRITVTAYDENLAAFRLQEQLGRAGIDSGFGVPGAMVSVQLDC